MRYSAAFLTLVITAVFALSLLLRKKRPSAWGFLELRDGTRLELKNRESLVGGSASSDVCLTTSRRRVAEGVIEREGNGCRIHPIGKKSDISVNGTGIKKAAAISDGDVLTIGGAETVFKLAEVLPEKERAPRSGVLYLLLVLALCSALFASFFFGLHPSDPAVYALGFGGAAAASVLLYIVNRAFKQGAFGVDAIGLSLSAIGMSVALSSSPENVYKELICLAAGIAVYIVLTLFLRSGAGVRALRRPIAILGLALIVFALLTAESILGAKNWIRIAGISFQPSELVKIAFVFAGAAPLYSVFNKRNLIVFIAFSALCVGALVLMSDFGTALVFFTAYLVMAFMRSGSFAAVALSASGAGLAAAIAVGARPYIAGRFSSWGRAWELYNEGGYQQVRTMTACASGGFFGLGAGKGWFKTVFAADTDMVFGVVSEELGLITAFAAVIMVLLLAVCAVKSIDGEKGGFYAIAACGAAAIMLAQLALNVFGALDILPFTGVTFPFVSNGGTSLIASWGLLAFIKAGSVSGKRKAAPDEKA